MPRGVRRKTETAEKKTTRRTRTTKSVEPSRKARPEPTKKAFVFFNCDLEKSQASKNIFYNNEIYRDVVAARKLLWDKIKEEVDSGRVQVIDEQYSLIRREILEGDPVVAAQYLQYGTIDALNIY